jgi:carboxymethylenebutenolidase
MAQITKKQIEIRTPDGIADGLVYQPDAGKGPWPGVLHLTDIGGIRAANIELSKRLAAAGYLVLLPNVFYRTGKPPLFTPPFTIGDAAFMKRVGELRAPLTPDALQGDAAAYVDFLAKLPGAKPGKFAVTGYCFTGAMAMLVAAQHPDKIGALATFHAAGLFKDDPASPHLLLPRITARLYFGHAFEDRGMPIEAIEKLNRAMDAWGGKYESKIYEGAGHGWTMPDMPVYNQPQAERAFTKLLELLAATIRN